MEYGKKPPQDSEGRCNLKPFFCWNPCNAKFKLMCSTFRSATGSMHRFTSGFLAYVVSHSMCISARLWSYPVCALWFYVCHLYKKAHRHLRILLFCLISVVTPMSSWYGSVTELFCSAVQWFVSKFTFICLKLSIAGLSSLCIIIWVLWVLLKHSCFFACLFFLFFSNFFTVLPNRIVKYSNCYMALTRKMMHSLN